VVIGGVTLAFNVALRVFGGSWNLSGQIKSVQDGTFTGGGNTVFGLDQDGVGLGTLSPKANADDVAATEKVEREIADGQITGIPKTLS